MEGAQPEAFDILVQATYTGYYSHPQVTAALGVDAAALEHQFDRFDDTLLDELDRRAAAAAKT